MLTRGTSKFKSLKGRLNGMPIIIAGPILRRVEKNSVTVWFASKKALSDVILEVINPKNKIVLSSHQEKTVALGKNLHVLAVTATLGKGLKMKETYLYNITFGEKNLSSKGIVAASNEDFRAFYCYGDHVLPSFVLPEDITKLKIIHGSCRKPHGGKIDALSGLDRILEASVNDVSRPQLQIFTGDQIYADDVSDILLYILRDAEDTLMNWDSGTELLPEELSLEQMMPGNRQNTVAPSPDKTVKGKLTSSHAKSHLITLSEFYCMYLFVWSDVLWPRNFPSINEVVTSLNDPIYKKIFDDIKDTKQKIEEGRIGELIDKVIESGNPIPPEVITYSDELSALNSFTNSLRFVRRGLANIPTYMIFDDHDVTDDWFLTREWFTNTMGQDSLSRRIIQNGMAAYAVFQAWGNTPDLFSNGHGQKLLGLMSSLVTTGNQAQIFNEIGDKVLPDLKNHQRELTGSKIPWHYNLEFKDFRLIILDTRTQRGYPSSAGSPALLKGQAINEQLPDRNADKEVTIIVSPAPVFGDIKIEEIQEISSYWSGMYTNDLEAWTFNSAAYESFIHHIASYGRVVCLSGDVHYSFSVSVKYWNERDSGKSRAAIAQLCCSSLKNSDSNTLSTNSWYLRPPSEKIFFVTWPTNGKHVKDLRGRDNSPKFVNVLANKLVKIKSPPFYPMIREGHNHKIQSRYYLAYIRNGKSSTFKDTVVGTDNIGVISFNWPENNQSEKKVIHSLWYSSPASSKLISQFDNPFQLNTIHEVPLVIPTDTEPHPGD